MSVDSSSQIAALRTLVEQQKEAVLRAQEQIADSQARVAEAERLISEIERNQNEAIALLGSSSHRTSLPTEQR